MVARMLTEPSLIAITAAFSAASAVTASRSTAAGNVVPVAMALPTGWFIVLAIGAAVLGFIIHGQPDDARVTDAVLCIAIAALILLVRWHCYSTVTDPSQAPSPLLHAAYQGDLATVQRMLPIVEPTKAQVNNDAAFAAHVEAQANVKDQWNNTALHVSWSVRDACALAIAELAE
jgi:hypothetical protein